MLLFFHDRKSCTRGSRSCACAAPRRNPSDPGEGLNELNPLLKFRSQWRNDDSLVLCKGYCEEGSAIVAKPEIFHARKSLMLSHHRRARPRGLFHVEQFSPLHTSEEIQAIDIRAFMKHGVFGLSYLQRRCVHADGRNVARPGSGRPNVNAGNQEASTEGGCEFPLHCRLPVSVPGIRQIRYSVGGGIFRYFESVDQSSRGCNRNPNNSQNDPEMPKYTPSGK